MIWWTFRTAINTHTSLTFPSAGINRVSDKDIAASLWFCVSVTMWFRDMGFMLMLILFDGGQTQDKLQTYKRRPHRCWICCCHSSMPQSLWVSVTNYSTSKAMQQVADGVTNIYSSRNESVSQTFQPPASFICDVICLQLVKVLWLVYLHSLRKRQIEGGGNWGQTHLADPNAHPGDPLRLPHILLMQSGF